MEPTFESAETTPSLVDIKESEDIVEVTDFNNMGLSENILRGIFAMGFKDPSKIQAKGIVPMTKGRDILAQAQAGTGKTGTFVIGSLSHVDTKINKVQVLVMCHVHELASQIADTAIRIGTRMKLKVHCAIGGEPVKNDIAKLQEGVHFLVGTPGRILDLIMRGAFDRSAIQWVILDEADHMLEDLFYTQVIKILETGFPTSTKTAFFSATFPPHVIEVAEKILQNPVRILIPPNQVRLNQIQQFFVDLEREDFKFDCLCDLYKNLSIQQTVIFCNKKQKAEWIAERMIASGLHVTCIHGDLEKPERRKRLELFRQGKNRVMVATDIISRGIDVQQLSLVINYELPPKSESYIHRIGRAGRYGRIGTTINLLIPEEYKMMESICEYYNLQVNPLPSDLSAIKACL